MAETVIRVGDKAFEFRYGEGFRFGPMDEGASLAVALFPVTSPGPMCAVTGTDDPSEPYKLCAVQRRGCEWAWLILGPVTHVDLCEAMHRQGVEKGKWHGLYIVPDTASLSAVA